MPGPAPRYRPLFTAEQISTLEQLVGQRNARYGRVQRAKLALLLHAEPAIDNVAAGKRLGQHPNWVRKWRKRWAIEGFSLEERPGRGRKPLFSPTGAGACQTHCL
jgi:transposase